jgi:hypothetical protein
MNANLNQHEWYQAVLLAKSDEEHKLHHIEADETRLQLDGTEIKSQLLAETKSPLARVRV